MSSMEEEMMQLVKEDPSKFIRYLEEHNLDFNQIGVELDIARHIVRDKYKMNDGSIAAVEFVFWFSYFVERETQDLIVEPEVQIGGRRESIEKLVDKLHFGDKISIISDLYVQNPKKDRFITLMRKVQDLRNDVAHGRFDKLLYDGYELSSARGQLKILGDLMNALLNKS